MSRAAEILDKYIDCVENHTLQYYSYEEVISILKDIKHELEDEYNR